MERVMQRMKRPLPQRRKLWSVIPVLLRSLLNCLQTLFTVDVDRVTEFVFHRMLVCYCVWPIPIADNLIPVFAVIDAPLEIVVYVNSLGIYILTHTTYQRECLCLQVVGHFGYVWFAYSHS